MATCPTMAELVAGLEVLPYQYGLQQPFIQGMNEFQNLAGQNAIQQGLGVDTRTAEQRAAAADAVAQMRASRITLAGYRQSQFCQNVRSAAGLDQYIGGRLTSDDPVPTGQGVDQIERERDEAVALATTLKAEVLSLRAELSILRARVSERDASMLNALKRKV